MQIKPKDTTVVLLAAGHGNRMRPLTNNTPKPLLKIGDDALIEHHLLRLANLGFRNIVINVAYLAQQIITTLGDGSKYGVSISYSDESLSGPLETAGGLKKALPLIKSDPFITINADIWTDFDFTKLLKNVPAFARLVMVKNPKQHANGDFTLNAHGRLRLPTKTDYDTNNALTFSGIAIYRRHVIQTITEGKAALAPVFRALIGEEKLDGERFDGVWHDIGTPERLDTVRAVWKSHNST